jgi:hypothetical protein
MYDMHKKMVTFYHQCVRLPKPKRDELAGHRDTNLERLNAGLDAMSEEDEQVYAHPIRHRDQGSYPMHTLNQRPENDYDIDVAIIFRKDDLPGSTCDARKRVERAFVTAGGNFKQPPKARTNAVTVWYEEGYHVDFAVYRESEDEYGDTVTEHAGADWKVRDPIEITEWFKRTVRERSPSTEAGATVETGQFRRVVRLLKAFAKSRESWNLPGGMIISKLVEECYSPDYYRDDLALYGTMSAIRTRLLGNVQVYDPIHTDQQLTYKDELVKQVERFRDRLGEALEQLAVLFQWNCTPTQGMNAWYWVFQHDFWRDDDAGGTAESPKGPSILRGSTSDVRESPPFA